MSLIKLILQAIIYPFKVLAITLVNLYKVIISPLLPHTCRFYPTCSTYLVLAIREWGVLRGMWLGVRRICRCRPRGKSGCDYVPINIKGDLKWIY